MDYHVVAFDYRGKYILTLKIVPNIPRQKETQFPTSFVFRIWRFGRKPLGGGSGERHTRGVRIRQAKGREQFARRLGTLDGNGVVLILYDI